MASIFGSKFRGKRILVTGGTGFVGSHLVEALVDCQASVVTTYQTIDPKSYFATQNLKHKTTMVMADVCDYDKLFHLVTRFEISCIFHLAAQPLVGVAYTNPRQTLATNILGTINVLECARNFPNITSVIVASSDKAYGKLSKDKYTETDMLAGDHPYEVSKSSADLICTAYYKTYGVPVVVTRFGNIYGEGDLNFSRIIPAILEAAITNRQLKIRSNGKYDRDYLYVKDVVNGYLLLATKLSETVGQAYNFGSSDSFSVLELVSLAQKVLKRPIQYKILDNAKNEIVHQSLDYKKIKALSWKPQVSLAQALPQMYDWYKEILTNG